MPDFQIIKIADHPDLINEAAEWFHSKWGIPAETYAASMKECLRAGSAVPQWYVVKDGSSIIAGLGVIDNDFHNRKDLTPNVCAVYVEEAYRRRGLAGRMLDFACADMKAKGIVTLYLLTNHTSFYERYNWEFLCMVRGDGESKLSRMYIHREQAGSSSTNTGIDKTQIE